ncbi:matrixin family metalloprotease [Aquabacterium sp.]|uniref:matrixin family metalloprotease n=1 Tax=Aquabacterium sp. TaxID=1872578 RepID=UPI003784EEE7
MFKPLSHARKLLAALFAAGTALSAQAAFVTTNEAGMDAIFSQSTFDGRNIDIRFNATVEVHNTALLVIDSSAEFDVTFRPSTTKAIAMYFVDDIQWCGGPTTSTIGCGWIGANGIAVNSSWAGDASYGANLMAHELGHNLGLGHSSGDNQNLMAPIIMTGMGTLTSAQVSSILSSTFVQTDTSGQRFVEITPYLVLPDLVITVPEPGSLALVGLALGLAAWRGRRASRA